MPSKPSASIAVTTCAVIGVLALGLAGCNETGGAGAAPVTSAAAVAPSAFGLPPNAPCSAEIGRYQAVVKDDLATGNLDRKVFDQIQGELARAASACSAGKGGEAHALVASSKARHGYRA